MEIIFSMKELEKLQSDQDFSMYPEKVPDHKVATTLRLFMKR